MAIFTTGVTGAPFASLRLFPQTSGALQFDIAQSGAEVHFRILSATPAAIAAYPSLVGSTIVARGNDLVWDSRAGAQGGTVTAIDFRSSLGTTIATWSGLNLGIVSSPFGPLPILLQLTDFVGTDPAALLAFEDQLTGSEAAESLHGGGGNDTLLGLGGHDTLNGGTGDDSISGGQGNDLIFGLGGRDSVNGDAGNDTIDGGGSNGGVVAINGGDGDDVLYSSAIYVGRNISLSGGADDDLVIWGEGHFLNAFGGDGRDVLRFDTSSAISTIYAQGASQFLPDTPAGPALAFFMASGFVGYNIDQFEVFVLSEQADEFSNGLATAAGRVWTYFGRGGGDTISGSEADETIFGGAGADSLLGNGGNDVLYAEAGGGTLLGGAGDDVLVSSAAGQGAALRMFGEGDNDQIFLTGIDIAQLIEGGGGDDVIRLNGENNGQVFGGDGDDVIAGFGGRDTLAGGAGQDTLFGGDDDDSLLGGLGNDMLLSGNGADNANGEDGNDAIALGADPDVGFGGAGDDTLFGEDASDTLLGEAGADILSGGAGDDLLLGGAGNDALVGGTGADRYAFDTLNWGYDQIFGFSRAEGDRIQFNGSGITTFGSLQLLEIGGNTALLFGTQRIDVYDVTGLMGGDFLF